MKKNGFNIKNIHTNQEHENPIDNSAFRPYKKSPNLNKSKSTDHQLKFQGTAAKKIKPQRQKVDPSCNWKYKCSKQQYKIQETNKFKVESKNKYNQFCKKNTKEKQGTSAKKEAASSSKDKNQYDLKQKRKSKPADTKRNKKQLNQNKKTQKQQRQKIGIDYRSENSPRLNAEIIKNHLLTPQPTSRLLLEDLREKIRNLSNKSWAKSTKKQDKSVNLYESDIYTTQPKLQRYDKFAFRSQKYIKLNEQIRAERENRQKIQPLQKQSCPKNQKAKSAFKRRVSKLNHEIDYFRQMYSKSERVLQTMQQLHDREQKQFLQKKQAYIIEIERLKNNLEQYKPNLGHIFSYKQFNNKKLVPDQIIIQGVQVHEDNQSALKPKIQKQAELQKAGEKLIDYYTSLEQQQKIQNQLQNEASSLMCISIISKQDN